MKVWYADELFHEQPNEPNNSVPVYEKSVADAVIAELRECIKMGMSCASTTGDLYSDIRVWEKQAEQLLEKGA